jgi:hypothetical protein
LDFSDFVHSTSVKRSLYASEAAERGGTRAESRRVTR